MLKPYIGLFVGVVAVSFASIFIRLAEAGPLVVGAYRLTIASLLLTPFAFLKGELKRLSLKDLAFTTASGLFLGLHFATWIASLSYTTVASSVMLVSTHPIFVGLVSHFLLKERVSRRIFFGIAISVVGSGVIGIGDLSVYGEALLGDFLALLGAIMASGYFLVGRRLRSHLPLLAYVIPTYWTAALILIAFCLMCRQPLIGYPPQTYLMFILLALIPQIIGHSSLNWALKYLSATFITVSVLGEPIGATTLAFLILKEVPTFVELIGGVLILIGIYLTVTNHASHF
jgi:drug/metabolite transporter (DMT)-like permease